MRALVIDDAAKREATRVVKWADEHPYKPGPHAGTPGDDPHFVAHLNSYRCVFTFTHDDQGKVWRHLSVSVPGGKYPNPIAVWMIADLFGFTGWKPEMGEKPGLGWGAYVDEGARCAVVAQEVPGTAG